MVSDAHAVANSITTNFAWCPASDFRPTSSKTPCSQQTELKFLFNYFSSCKLWYATECAECDYRPNRSSHRGHFRGVVTYTCDEGTTGGGVDGNTFFSWKIFLQCFNMFRANFSFRCACERCDHWVLRELSSLRKRCPTWMAVCAHLKYGSSCWFLPGTDCFTQLWKRASH